MTADESMPLRRTRSEARAQTRQRLLDAAMEVFLETGFAAASVEEIAARAGFTRGAFYSNFGDKEDIFLALMDARLEERISEAARLVTRSGAGNFLTELRAWSRDHDIADWVLLAAEFRVHALRSATARERLVERDRAERAAYAHAIRAQFDRAGVEPPAPVEQLALIVHGLTHALRVQEHLDPERVGEDVLFGSLSLLFEAAVALSEAREHHDG